MGRRSSAKGKSWRRVPTTLLADGRINDSVLEAHTCLRIHHVCSCRHRISFHLFIYLAASGLSCGTWDLRCSMRDLSLRHAAFSLAVAQAPACSGSVDAAHGLSCPAACGIPVSPTRDGTCIPCTGRQILNHWTTREIPDIAFLLQGNMGLQNSPPDCAPGSRQQSMRAGMLEETYVSSLP